MCRAQKTPCSINTLCNEAPFSLLHKPFTSCPTVEQSKTLKTPSCLKKNTQKNNHWTWCLETGRRAISHFLFASRHLVSQLCRRPAHGWRMNQHVVSIQPGGRGQPTSKWRHYSLLNVNRTILLHTKASFHKIIQKRENLKIETQKFSR